MVYKLLVPGPIDDVEQVRLLEWHVDPGETCEVGQLVVELETHKALVEVRAEQQAVLRSILAESGIGFQDFFNRVRNFRNRN